MWKNKIMTLAKNISIDKAEIKKIYTKSNDVSLMYVW